MRKSNAEYRLNVKKIVPINALFNKCMLPVILVHLLLASFPSLQVSAFLQITGKTEYTVRNCKLTKFFLNRKRISKKSENNF